MGIGWFAFRAGVSIARGIVLVSHDVRCDAPLYACSGAELCRILSSVSECGAHALVPAAAAGISAPPVACASASCALSPDPFATVLLRVVLA